MTKRSLTILLAVLALASCGEGANGDGVGGVSASEARALNEAAEMLDKRAAAPVSAAAPGLNPAARRAAEKDGK